MRHAVVTLVKSLLIAAVILALADYFELSVFSEAGAASASVRYNRESQSAR